MVVLNFVPKIIRSVKNRSFFSKICWKIRSFSINMIVFSSSFERFKIFLFCWFFKERFISFVHRWFLLPERHPFPRKISFVLNKVVCSNKRCPSLLGGGLEARAGGSLVDQDKVGSMQFGNQEENKPNQKSRLKVTIK